MEEYPCFPREEWSGPRGCDSLCLGLLRCATGFGLSNCQISVSAPHLGSRFHRLRGPLTQGRYVRFQRVKYGGDTDEQGLGSERVDLTPNIGALRNTCDRRFISQRVLSSSWDPPCQHL